MDGTKVRLISLILAFFRYESANAYFFYDETIKCDKAPSNDECHWELCAICQKWSFYSVKLR